MIQTAQSVELDVKKRIAASQYHRACFHDVSVHFADGVLTLHGTLPSYYMKQMLQTLLRDVDGVDSIDNLTDVSR